MVILRRLKVYAVFFFTTFIVFVSLPCTAQQGKPSSITMAAIPDLSPITTISESGNPEGFFVDLIEQIGKEENIQIRYNITDWQTGFSQIQSGEIDLMPGIIWSEERDRIIDFHNEPVFVSWGQVFVHTDSDISSVFDLDGKVIGIMRDDESAKNFKNLVRGFNIICSFVEVAHLDEVTALIEDGTVDAGVFYNVVNPNSNHVVHTSIVFDPSKVFYATGPRSNEVILNIIDEYLVAWKEERDSFYYKALNKWFGVEQTSVKVTPSWIYLVFGIAAAVVFMLFLWTWTLRKAVDRKTGELVESEKKFRNLFERSGLPGFLCSEDGKILMANEYTNELFDDEPGDLSQPKLSDVLPEAVALELQELIKRVAESGNGTVYEGSLVFKGQQNCFFFNIQPFPERNDKGKTVQITAQNITKRKQAENEIRHSLEEKEVLLKEIHHRVKNNLQIISSMLNLQESTVKDAAVLDIFKTSKNRIYAMALAHEELYGSRDMASINVKEYVSNLCSRTLSSYHQNNMSFSHTLSIPGDLVFPVEIMMPLGLILNEFITNSIKHGLPEDGQGHISIHVTLDTESCGITYKDNGPGLPEAFDLEDVESLGLNLVKQLVMQIRGHLDFRRFPLEFTLRFLSVR